MKRRVVYVIMQEDYHAEVCTSIGEVWARIHGFTSQWDKLQLGAPYEDNRACSMENLKRLLKGDAARVYLDGVSDWILKIQKCYIGG